MSKLKSLISYLVITIIVAIGLNGNFETVVKSSKVALYVVVIGIFIFGVFNFKKKYTSKNMFLYLVCLATLLFWMLIRSESLDGLLRVGQFALVAALPILYYGRRIQPLKFPVRYGYFLAIGTAVFHFFVDPIFGNPNYIALIVGVYCLPLLYELKGRFVQFGILLIIYLGMLYVCGSKSVILGVFFGVLFTFGVLSARVKRSTRIYALVGMLTLIFLIFSIYSNFVTDGYYYNSLSLQLTGRRLESGRIEIWQSLLGQLSGIQKIIGAGESIDYVLQEDYLLSAHSVYIYMYITYGVIGLLFLLLLMYASIKLLLLHERFTLSLVLVVMLSFRDMFEVSIVTNNFPVSLIFWYFGVCGFFYQGFIRNKRTSIVE